MDPGWLPLNFLHLTEDADAAGGEYCRVRTVSYLYPVETHLCFFDEKNEDQFLIDASSLSWRSSPELLQEGCTCRVWLHPYQGLPIDIEVINPA